MKRFVAALAATIGLLGAGCGHSAPSGGAAAQTPVGASPQPIALSASPASNSTPAALSFSDKSGTVKIGRGAVDPDAMRIPLYPGAVQDPTSSSSSTAAGGSVAITALDTGDSYAAVVAWYREHVPAGAQVTHLHVGGESTMSYDWTQNGGREDRTVTISTNHGKPIITISLRIQFTSP